MLDLFTLVLADVAPDPVAGATGGIASFLPLILLFVVFYFLMIRPQMKRQKEHKAMVDKLAPGDEVIAAGGIFGRISEVHEGHVVLSVNHDSDNSVRILVQRQAVLNVLAKGTLKSL